MKKKIQKSKTSLDTVVSNKTAAGADVVYVNMQLDLWGALGWVKQQGENS